jgi:hypothetical protein
VRATSNATEIMGRDYLKRSGPNSPLRGAKLALATVYSCSATDLNFRKVLTPKVKPIRINAQ